MYIMIPIIMYTMYFLHKTHPSTHTHTHTCTCTSDPTGFLAAFMEVAPVGLRGESWSSSGRFTGTGMEGIELFL